jgi:low affinity Fe/Cu permease
MKFILTRFTVPCPRRAVQSQNNRLLSDAKKMDEKLDNYIQYLLAKVVEADKPLSAIDLEKEERTQKQKKATEDLLADNQQIFTLWNELVCAKEILADLMTNATNGNS